MYGVVIASAIALVGLAWAFYQWLSLHTDARPDPPVKSPPLDVYEGDTTWIPTNRGRVRRRDLPNIKADAEPTGALYVRAARDAT